MYIDRQRVTTHTFSIHGLTEGEMEVLKRAVEEQVMPVPSRTNLTYEERRISREMRKMFRRFKVKDIDLEDQEDDEPEEPEEQETGQDLGFGA